MTTSGPTDVRGGARRGGAEDVVELSIPVRADLVVLARLTAATVASRASFDVEEIEDLRLAVDELCVSLVGDGSEGRLALRFVRGNEDIEVSCTYHADSTQDGEAPGSSSDGLSARILDALVDEHGRDGEGGRQRIWLRKRRARPQA
jgi:anti-sigma regulatory factor (Ser/Thr protein kinase)